MHSLDREYSMVMIEQYETQYRTLNEDIELIDRYVNNMYHSYVQ